MRRLRDDDLDELVGLFVDAKVWWFEYERGLSVAETGEFLDRQKRLWDDYGFGGCAVREREGHTLLGVVGLGVPTLAHSLLPPVTIGWRFASTAWGHGYATEAASALLHQAFGPMGLTAVGCVTNADNASSVAVAHRLRMEEIAEEDVLRDDGLGTAVALILRVDRDRWIGPDDGTVNA